MLSAISKIHDAALTYESSKSDLREIVKQSIAEAASYEPDLEELERADAVIVGGLFNNADPQKLFLNRARINRDLYSTVRDVYEELTGSDEHASFTDSIAIANRAVEQLVKALTPSSLIERVVITGTCAICGVNGGNEPEPLQSINESSGDPSAANSWEERAGVSLVEESN